jgi:hypothetical protein
MNPIAIQRTSRSHFLARLMVAVLAFFAPQGRVQSDDPIVTETQRLERAIDGMRRASQRIETDDTSAETVELQRRVLADLEKLLESLKRRQQGRSNNPQQNPQQGPQQNDRQQLPPLQPDQQNSGKRQEQQSQSQDSQRQRTEAEKARESQARENPAAPTDEEARRQRMIKDVWGHLPPHLREAIGRTFNEKYLPKYDELIKQYYETLAERNRKRSGSSADAPD